MKTTKTVFLAIGAIGAIAMLSGCPTSTTGSSTAVNTFAKGVITAKGSVFINGIEYETTASEITLDNLAGTDSFLKVGMVVSVKGSADPESGKGNADKINYASSIEGTVDSGSINTTTGLFSVFGLDISTNAKTVYEGIGNLLDLNVGDRVEVSGILNATTNVIDAARVEVKTGSTDDYKVQGTIETLSGATNGTFTLRLESGATLAATFTGTLAAGIANSSLVKIELANAPIAGAFTTTSDKIELKSELEIGEGDRVEIEGVIDGFTTGTPNTFTVNGISVSATSAILTELVPGSENGTEVEVEGTMIADVLIASEVSVEHDADLEFKGVITSPNISAGTFLLNGVILHTNTLTIFNDDLNTPVELFGLDDLTSGDYAEAKAFLDPDSGVFTAALLDRHEADPTAEMKGVVTAKNAGTFTVTVLGLEILTTPLFATTGERDTFLSTVAIDDKVKLTGTISGTTVTWETIVID